MMQSHYDFFKTGYEYFQQCQERMQELADATTQLQKISDASVAQRRSIRRQLEKGAFAHIASRKVAGPTLHSNGIRDQVSASPVTALCLLFNCHF